MNRAGHTVEETELFFTIDNHGNNVQINSPDMTGVLSGQVTLMASGADSEYFPSYYIANIDGTSTGIGYSDNAGLHSTSVHMSLDTTAFPNGTHGAAFRLLTSGSAGQQDVH